MSENHQKPQKQQQQRQERLFAKWTETELTPDEQTQFDSWCREDQAFADRIAVYGRINHIADNFEAQDVPEWDSGALFKVPAKTPWWQWSGLSVASFAMSFVAIMLVTFKFEVTVHGDAMTISFAGSQQEQQIQQLVDARLTQFKQAQSAHFNQQSEQLQQQQVQMNTQLANYLLSTSRTERREDFAELIKFVNEQRNDDQVFYARQLNRLQADFVAESGGQGWLPGDFNTPDSDK